MASEHKTSWSSCALCTLPVRVRTPSGMDLLAGGGVVYLRVEKNPSSAPRQSTGLRPAQSHGSCGVAVYGWGRGSRVFSTCVRMSSSS